ncbi:MAG: response regulator transcription factor [Proteobacteria bacterium]|nr:response regulator transcription factor [Pseudomonadota bacterium]
MIRLLLVDDHKIVREALCSVLEREPDIAVVGQAGDGETALALVAELMPQVVLMDIAMPGISGIEATRQIVAEFAGVNVLALSTYFDRRIVTQMLEAGAGGFVNKAAGRDELLQGIRAVVAGKPYLCQEIASMLVKPQGGAETQLGRREIEVLQLLVDGSTSAEIADRLHIATSTVEVHRRNIMRKLDLHSVAELTKYAIRQGLISA